MIKRCCKYCMFILSVSILMISAACTKRQLNITPLASSIVEIRTVLSDNIIQDAQCDSVLLFFYRSDTMVLREKIKVPYDKIEIPCGEYQIIMLDERYSRVECSDMDNYFKAKLLLKSYSNDSPYSLENILCYSRSSFYVVENTPNQLVLEPENLAKSIDYQLIIEGAADSLERCVVTQPGIARGIIIFNKELLFGEDSGAQISFEATKENNYSGKVNILGVNPGHNKLELSFVFSDNKTQNSSINISTVINDQITAKKVIMYIDVSVIDLEINASVKSWIVVEDTINM